MALDREPTYQTTDGVTGQQALAQARAANLATRRRWPAVQSAVAAVAALREIYDPPTVVLHPVRRSA